MTPNRLKKVLPAILIGAILTATAVHLFRPINEPDFFWHLKTGEWIWQEKALPAKDPFSYTTPQFHTPREHFILTSYWLSQLLYHLVHVAGGMDGIVALRFLFAGLLIAVMLGRQQGDRIIYLSLLLVFVTHFFESYTLERPQIYSFLFFGLLLLLLERLRSGGQSGEKSAWFIPPLMLLWANMHGGHLMGQALIVFYMIMEGVKFIHPTLRPAGIKAYRKLAAYGTGGLFLSVVNPNTWHAAVETLQVPGDLVMFTTEYISTLRAFVLFQDYGLILYWSMLFAAFAGTLMNIRKIDITEAALLAAAGAVSFFQIRYVAFFMLAAIPPVSRMWSGLSFTRWVRAVCVVASLSAALLFSRDDAASMRNLRPGSWVSGYQLPVKAADFILANDLRGNMYNFNSWGGYLLWRLGPDRKVFTDTRNMHWEVSSKAILIENAFTKSTAGLPFWKAMLESHRVAYAVIPIFEQSGRLLPLLHALMIDDEWAPVFFDRNTTIFVRRSPENSRVLGRFSIPREYFIDDLIGICQGLVQGNPQIIFPRIALGDLYMVKGDFPKALETYTSALRINPRNPIVIERLKHPTFRG